MRRKVLIKVTNSYDALHFNNHRTAITLQGRWYQNNIEMETGQKSPEKIEKKRSYYAWIPDSVLIFFEDIAGYARFSIRFFREVFRPPFEFREFFRQCFEVGYRSLPLVSVTALIMGLVFTLQSRPTLMDFGAESLLPSMVAISIVREIGPIITALICAGRIGSSIGAEIGSMKVTEQIDAMEVSGTNPFKYVVVTRMAATTLMLPLLVILGDAISIFGAYLGVNIEGNVSFVLFIRKSFRYMYFWDIYPAVIKCFFFGFAIGLVGCYQGYHSEKGTEGVGAAANTSVVVASLFIFILDLLAFEVTDLLIKLIGKN